MRVKKNQIEFLKKIVRSFLPDASIFLFGSRVFYDMKGGDIDLLVLGDRQLTGQEKRSIKIAFHKKFGEQKIDIVSFIWDDPSTFKDIAMRDAVQI
jgi:predicted nucleotidyltransferase